MQPLQPALWRVAGDDGAVDRANRRAHHPLRQHAVRAQGFIDPGLVRPERATALQHQHLADRVGPGFACGGFGDHGAAADGGKSGFTAG